MPIEQGVIRKPGTFPPGVSGNVKGRPKGQRDYRTIYLEALRKIGEARDMTPEQVEEELHRSGLDKALKGDFAFYRDTLDRLHGKPVQKTEVTGKDGERFQFSMMDADEARAALQSLLKK